MEAIAQGRDKSWSIGRLHHASEQHQQHRLGGMNDFVHPLVEGVAGREEVQMTRVDAEGPPYRDAGPVHR
jgi:hypothetical protein